MKSSRFYFFVYLAVLFLFSSVPIPTLAQSPLLSITDDTLVSKVRVGRSVYEYTFRAKVTNNGVANALNVGAVLTSVAPNVEIVDDSIVFGTVPVGATVTSTDTFTIKLDRKQPFDRSTVTWSVHSDQVIGPAGGKVMSYRGARLTFPPGSVASPVTVGIRDKAPNDIGVSVPAGHTFLGAVTVNVGDEPLAHEATLEIPMQNAPVGHVIVARVLQFGGISKLSLVDTAKFESPGILRTNSPPFTGVRTSGDFVFLAMPPNLGIVGTHIQSPSGAPLEGATVKVLVNSLGASTTSKQADQSLASLSAFIGLSDATGFAAVPGVVPNSEVAAVAFSPSEAGMALAGAIQFPVGDVLTGGLLGNWLQNLIVTQNFQSNSLPDTDCACDCDGPFLFVVPHEMGITTPFFPGESQDIKHVFCGINDVANSTNLTSAGLGLLTTGGSGHVTTYLHRPDHGVVTLSERKSGGPVVTAKTPGKTEIGVSVLRMCLFISENIVVPKYCTANGRVYPVVVTGASPSLTVTKNSGSGKGTVSSVPSGISCGNTCASVFSTNKDVSLIATPDAGSEITKWSGDCSGMSKTVKVGMNTDKSCEVVFDLVPRIVTVTKTGSGSGTVSSTPQGLVCGNTCSVSFDANSIVSLTASPSAGAVFTNWNGDCSGTSPTVTLALDTDKTCEAVFDLRPRIMTVSKSGNGSGTVSSTPPGLTCGNTCSASFDANSIVSLTAYPSAGAVFTGWSGDCSGTQAQTSVLMDSAKSCSAQFDTVVIAPVAVRVSGNAKNFTLQCPILGGFCGRHTASEPYDEDPWGVHLAPTNVHGQISGRTIHVTYGAAYDFSNRVHGGGGRNEEASLQEKLQVYVPGDPGTPYKLEYELSGKVLASKTKFVSGSCGGSANVRARWSSTVAAAVATRDLGDNFQQNVFDTQTFVGTTSNPVITVQGLNYSLAKEFSVSSSVVLDIGFCVDAFSGHAEYDVNMNIEVVQ